MSKELFVSSTPHETKVAIVEEDQLAEIYYERENEYTLAGSIYKGRVTRVLPGMQSAFVNIGLERDAFLYVSDFLEENEDIERITEERPPRAARAESSRMARSEPSRPARLEPSRTARSEESPALAAGHAPAEAGPEPGEETAAPSAPGEEREDRRGRRSRRRRNRGRGFPESKYATEPAAATGTTAQAPESADGGEQPPAEQPPLQ